LSIHPERIEASHERKTPILQWKTRAECDYSEGRKRTQGRNRKNEGKNAIFLKGCAKRAGFMRVGAKRAQVAEKIRRGILPNPK
jgi:hypothetical protein